LGVLGRVRLLSGTSGGTSGGVGTLRAVRGLSGGSGGASGGAGVLTPVRAVEGLSAALSGAAGELRSIRRMVGSSGGISGADGSLTNPDAVVIEHATFETDTDVHTAWYGCTIARDNGDAHGGAWSLLVTPSGGSGAVQLNNYPYHPGIVAGQDYNFTCWYRGTSAGSMPTVTWHVVWRTDSGSSLADAGTVPMPPSADWAQVGATFTAPPGAVRVYWRFTFTGGSPFRIDDVLVQSTGAAERVVLLTGLSAGVSGAALTRPLVRVRRLVGVSGAHSGAGGSLRRVGGLVGVSGGESGSAGGVGRVRLLAGLSAGVAAAALVGSPVRVRSLAGTTGGSSGGSGSLLVRQAVRFLSGISGGVSGGLAALRGIRRLAGISAGISRTRGRVRGVSRDISLTAVLRPQAWLSTVHPTTWGTAGVVSAIWGAGNAERTGWASTVFPTAWTTVDVQVSGWSAVSFADWVANAPYINSPSEGTPIMLEASTEYIKVPVTPAKGPNGMPIDISGDIVDISVVKGTPTDEDWKTAAWIGTPDPSTGQLTARLLVSPVTFGLSAGDTASVYIRVTDNPEIPVLKAGQLMIT
jgi:hypothetical protein